MGSTIVPSFHVKFSQSLFFSAPKIVSNQKKVFIVKTVNSYPFPAHKKYQLRDRRASWDFQLLIISIQLYCLKSVNFGKKKSEPKHVLIAKSIISFPFQWWRYNKILGEMIDWGQGGKGWGLYCCSSFHVNSSSFINSFLSLLFFANNFFFDQKKIFMVKSIFFVFWVMQTS